MLFPRKAVLLTPPVAAFLVLYPGVHVVDHTTHIAHKANNYLESLPVISPRLVLCPPLSI